jgi:hypothetical protein
MSKEEQMMYPVVAPPEVMPSVYGTKLPTQRATEIEGMVSLRVKDLFPDIGSAICDGREGMSHVRQATRDALAKVDMSMISPNDKLNILCSEHGFGMDGGWAYAEELKTIRDVIVERTGCSGVWLVVIAYQGYKESEEIVEYFGFREYFNGKVRTAMPFDKGVPIETEIGTLYGLAKVFDARWIIHCHYDDPREVYIHRLIDRTSKPFGMSYARFETRAMYHYTFGARTGNFVGRAILDSSFVKSKLAFSTCLISSPDGIAGVDADNDIDALGERTTCHTFQAYGKMMELFRRIDGCIIVLDGGKWHFYQQAGGMILGQLLMNGLDWWDLTQGAAPFLHEAAFGALNKNIKAFVVNQTLVGLSAAMLPMLAPVIMASEEMAEVMRRDSCNPTFMDHAVTAPNLEDAIRMARDIGGTDKIIFFDGSYGNINLSPSMAKDLIRKAEGCSAVMEEKLPMWLKQRGIDPGKPGRRAN